MPYKAREVLAKLHREGFQIKRQSRSHVILRHPEGRRTCVAMHSGDTGGHTAKHFEASGPNADEPQPERFL